MDFFDKLRKRYTEKEFTEHLGVLLLDVSPGQGHTTIEEIIAANNFCLEIYDLATECLGEKIGE